MDQESSDRNPVAAELEVRLEAILAEIGSCVVAFSGGVDSAYLAFVANRVLAGRALAVTAESPSFPESQKAAVLDLVGRCGLRHEFICTSELEDADYAANPVNRCYFCKRELFGKLRRLAAERELDWLVDGSNRDDLGDYRPGRAAAESFHVRSPLIEAGMGKAEIRTLSERHGLPTWNQPASACLSSRIPYGSPVTREKLRMIEEGESLLRGMGFRQVRVRHHGDLARIEIAPEEMAGALAPGVFDRIVPQFKDLGFHFVALDMEGYRTGALNAALPNAGGRRARR